MRPIEDRSIINQIIDQWHYEHETFRPKPKEFNFEDNIKEIKAIARAVAKKWNNTFEVDELVNEAWLGIGNQTFPILNQLRSAAKYKMIDYIRTIYGRRANKMAAHSISNTVNKNEEEIEKFGQNIEPWYVDQRFKQAEDKELLKKIMSTTATGRTAREDCLQTFTQYHLEGDTIENMAKELGKTYESVNATLCYRMRTYREAAQELQKTSMLLWGKGVNI